MLAMLAMMTILVMLTGDKTARVADVDSIL